MTVLNTGATKKYATGWENIFGGASKSSASRKATQKTSTGSAKKKKSAKAKTGQRAKK